MVLYIVSKQARFTACMVLYAVSKQGQFIVGMIGWPFPASTGQGDEAPHNMCQGMACGMQQALASLAVGKRESIPFPPSLAHGSVSTRCDSARENRCSYKPESRQPNNRCAHLVRTYTAKFKKALGGF